MAARGIAKQILGTVVAVLSGWFAAMLFLEATTAVELLHQPHYIVPEALLVAPITTSMVMSWFVIPVWLFALIPLYLFVPPSSVLWRLPVCSACGVIAGVLIVACWVRGIPGIGGLAPEAWWLYIYAAIVGGVTCFIAALTRHVFRPAI
jgi:hypothetical protein